MQSVEAMRSLVFFHSMLQCPPRLSYINFFGMSHMVSHKTLHSSDVLMFFFSVLGFASK